MRARRSGAGWVVHIQYCPLTVAELAQPTPPTLLTPSLTLLFRTVPLLAFVVADPAAVAVTHVFGHVTDSIRWSKSEANG